MVHQVVPTCAHYTFPQLHAAFLRRSRQQHLHRIEPPRLVAPAACQHGLCGPLIRLPLEHLAGHSHKRTSPQRGLADPRTWQRSTYIPHHDGA
eukprot:12923355-Prorocentrum_lima.AAC.1